jgi:hypothetical protein
MIVNGYEVPQNVIDACVARMKRGGFDAWELARVVDIAAPCSKESAADIARAIIQHNRKAGHIRYDGKVWRWVGGAK